jgi:hypothetical protein
LKFEICPTTPGLVSTQLKKDYQYWDGCDRSVESSWPCLPEPCTRPFHHPELFQLHLPWQSEVHDHWNINGDHWTFVNKCKVVYDGLWRYNPFTLYLNLQYEEVVLGIQPQKVQSVESWNILNVFGTPLDFLLKVTTKKIPKRRSLILLTAIWVDIYR